MAQKNGRVALGDRSPRAPTDPYVQDSRIRFLKSHLRFVPGTPNGSPQEEVTNSVPEHDYTISRNVDDPVCGALTIYARPA